MKKSYLSFLIALFSILNLSAQLHVSFQEFDGNLSVSMIYEDYHTCTLSQLSDMVDYSFVQSALNFNIQQLKYDMGVDDYLVDSKEYLTVFYLGESASIYYKGDGPLPWTIEISNQSSLRIASSYKTSLNIVIDWICSRFFSYKNF